MDEFARAAAHPFLMSLTLRERERLAEIVDRLRASASARAGIGPGGAPWTLGSFSAGRRWERAPAPNGARAGERWRGAHRADRRDERDVRESGRGRGRLLAGARA